MISVEELALLYHWADLSGVSRANAEAAWKNGRSEAERWTYIARAVDALKWRHGIDKEVT